MIAPGAEQGSEKEHGGGPAPGGPGAQCLNRGVLGGRTE